MLAAGRVCGGALGLPLPAACAHGFSMNTSYFAFGETLWDCFPNARHAGGAPLNVAAYLAQLGAAAGLISAVGSDALGDELLQIAQDKHIDTRFVGRAPDGLATGTVQVTLNAQGNASYEIVQPVAWDDIAVSDEAAHAVAQSRALVFGSLAARSPHNLARLERLLETPGPTRFFDVNLRPPFDGPARVLALARRADVLKFNDDELGFLAAWVQTGSVSAPTPRTWDDIAQSCATLARATNTRCLCITRGAEGAALWDSGTLLRAPAPPTVVRDTVGAGDAFMACLVYGLTRGVNPQKVLERACRLGAYVASQDGATPPLPPDLAAEFQSTVS